MDQYRERDGEEDRKTDGKILTGLVKEIWKV